MNFLWLLLIPVFIFVDSAYSFWQLNRIYQKYMLWFRGDVTVNIARERSALHRLITHAGIADRAIPRIHPLGYGQICHIKLGDLDQIPSKDEEITAASTLLIPTALGVYQDRMKNAFNPLWWIDTLIFLPRAVLTYINISAESVIIRIGQLIWWMIGLVFTAYKTEIVGQIREFIAALLGNSLT